MNVTKEELEAGRKILEWYRRASSVRELSLMTKHSPHFQNANISDVHSITEKNRRAIDALFCMLKPDEKAFVSRFMESDFFVTHATDSFPENNHGDLILYSRRQLEYNKIAYNDISSLFDTGEFLNDGFVFFSLEIGQESKKKISRFGSAIYRTKFNQPIFNYSVLYLTDLAIGGVENFTSARRISGLSESAITIINARKKHTQNLISFGRESSLKFIAVNIIEAARALPESDRKIILEAHSQEQFNNIMNGLFRPQVLVPKIVGLRSGTYSKYGASRNQNYRHLFGK